MARVALTVQPIYVDPTAATDISFGTTNAGSGNGLTFAHTKTKPAVLLVKNGAGDPIVATVKSNGTLKDGVVAPDLVFTIADAADRIIVVPPDEYSTAGVVAVDFDVAEGVGVAAVSFGKVGTKYTLPYESAFLS